MNQQPQQPQQPEQQQQFRPLPPPMMANLPSSPDDDFFKYRIDGTDILNEIEHQLKGEIYDQGANKFVQKFERWINDEGVNKILHVIYACGINKNIFLGNLLKDEILYKCRSLKKKLAVLFFKKYHDFGVPKEMRDLLIMTVINTVHSALSRSECGKEADAISVAAQRYEIFQHQDEQQKKGLMSKLPFLGGRI